MQAALRGHGAAQAGAGVVITVSDIVDSGLCIGCGLCRSIAPDSIEIRLMEDGTERPIEVSPPSESDLRLINDVCPGLRVTLKAPAAPVDTMWGPVLRLARGHATDPAVRFRSATGGVLTALGIYLLESGRVSRIVHVAPSTDDPILWQAQVSETRQDVLDGSGSRYGPAAPLTETMSLVADGAPVALIAKPCDAAAVRNLQERLDRARQVFEYLLVMACGGASRLTKHLDLLESLGVDRAEVVSLRHRGYGNPGPTSVTLRDGRSWQVPYREMWEDESRWDLQWRCKVCPDGMGEVADLVALDCWPGGVPEGEDTGFNGIIARTPVGADLLAAAIAEGVLYITDDGLEVDATLQSWQPHQSRRKAAVRSRLDAMGAHGLPALETPGLRLDEAAERLTPIERQTEYDGAYERIARFRR
jgi:coenzyme F420 hydrogenase subunit beta